MRANPWALELVTREELRSRLKLKAAVFNPLMAQAAAENLLTEAGALVHAPGHEVRFSPAQQEKIDTLLREFNRLGINSPSVKECKTAVGEDVYFALVDLGTLRPISADVVYDQATYEQLIARLLKELQAKGNLNAAGVRDLLRGPRASLPGHPSIGIRDLGVRERRKRFFDRAAIRTASAPL